MKIPLYKQDGTQDGEVAVNETIFGHKINKALIHRILLLQLSNKRHPIAHTKTKGEISGGGIKPYKQKGTGNARQGSSRNPHFRGGGVAFGPRNVRNFELAASKKERRGALFGVLSDKMKNGDVSALEGFTSEKPKAKAFNTMLTKLPLKKNFLFVLPEKDENFVKSSRNIPRAKTILVNYINLADLLKFKNIIFVKDATKKMEEIFLKTY